MGLAVKYPRVLRVVLFYYNLGTSIDRVHIGRALGWDVEICGVLWSHILALRQALPSCSNPILGLGQTITFHPIPQIYYK